MKRLRIIIITVFGIFCIATAISVKPVVSSFNHVYAQSKTLVVSDRNGIPLSISYQSNWNILDNVALYDMPDLLVQSFIFSEDKNFYNHFGVDWRARFSALYQNIKQRQTVRGASTITEQVVRILNPRPRNIWSKWVEGVEAMILETRIDKKSILEFYINQIPYAAHRRGVSQAARYYFNRNLDTLSSKEILALVVLARAPSAYDLYKNLTKIETSIKRLANQMKDKGVLSQTIYDDIMVGQIKTSPPSLATDARHFTRFISLNTPPLQKSVLKTTLDSALQSQIQGIIDTRIKKLSPKNAINAGVLVMDHTNGEILSWVSAGALDDDTKGGDIDPITTPRQPGSTLKPFLYANALDLGWNAGTFLNDVPISEAVGSGLHRFRNYSNTHYGVLTLREALGNSLNIPAILTINHVGVEKFLNTLHALGFESLNRNAAIYDEGLALGNGEVTLLELVGAYAALANKGVYSPPRYVWNDPTPIPSSKIFTTETSSIIGNILSDPAARSLEFGQDSILNLPYRTAIKTGTSTDYRDAWAVGYNDKYVVGIWMGNLDRTPMKEVTGSTGPALALRSIFNILNKDRDIKPLYLSPTLISHDICTRPSIDGKECPMRTEIFANLPQDLPPQSANIKEIELIRPTDGLMIAYDPRIAKDHQKFRFELSRLNEGDDVEWVLNGNILSKGSKPSYLWDVTRGKYDLKVVIRRSDNTIRSEKNVGFLVR